MHVITVAYAHQLLLSLMLISSMSSLPRHYFSLRMPMLLRVFSMIGDKRRPDAVTVSQNAKTHKRASLASQIWGLLYIYIYIYCWPRVVTEAPRYFGVVAPARHGAGSAQHILQNRLLFSPDAIPCPFDQSAPSTTVGMHKRTDFCSTSTLRWTLPFAPGATTQSSV